MYVSRTKAHVLRLQRGDPLMWTRLLRRGTGVSNLRVQAVKAENSGVLTRFTVELAEHTDPITLIGKVVSPREAGVLTEFGAGSSLMPRCWFNYKGGDSNWIVIGDTAHATPSAELLAGEVERIVVALADLHAAYWGDKETLLRHEWLPFLLGRRRSGDAQPLNLEEQLVTQTGITSEHAVRSMQGLAPRWLEAAGGLRVLLDLDGWPGVLEEKHLRAMADLMDDPLPLLHTLRELPLTLVHGFPGSYNWRVNPLSLYLTGWQHAAIGPGVYDLAVFLETFRLLQDEEMQWQVRDPLPMSEETMVDTYILTLAHATDADMRQVRSALPAARCLHIMLTWLPRFAAWFSQLPADLETRRDIWRSISSYSEEDLAGTIYGPIAGLRPYLGDTFQRFLRAYYQLS